MVKHLENGSSLTNKRGKELPSWFKPDPDAEEKGRLLYLEEWAKTRRFQDWTLVLGGVVVCLLASFMIIVGVAAAFSGEFNAVAVFVPFGLFLFLFGYFLMLGFAFEYMPFAIYENGVTLTSVARERGFHRMEKFVPWLEVRSIELRKRKGDYRFPVFDIVIKFRGHKEQRLSGGCVKDPLFLFDLLKSLVPEKLAPSLTNYLETIQEKKTPQIHVTADRYDLSDPLGLVSAPIFLFLGGYILLSTSFDLLVVFLSSICFLFAGLMFQIIVGPKDQGIQRELIRFKASCSPEGIMIPKTFFGKSIKNIRNRIPWNEVSAVRVNVHPWGFFPEAKVELFSGEHFLAPYTIFETAYRLSEFEKNGRDYVNTSPERSSNPLIRWNLLALFGLMLADFLPGLLLLYFSIS